MGGLMGEVAVRRKVAEVEEEDRLEMELEQVLVVVEVLVLVVVEVLVLLVEEELGRSVVLAFGFSPSAPEPCRHRPPTLSCQGPCFLSPPSPSRRG